MTAALEAQQEAAFVQADADSREFRWLFAALRGITERTGCTHIIVYDEVGGERMVLQGACATMDGLKTWLLNWLNDPVQRDYAWEWLSLLDYATRASSMVSLVESAGNNVELANGLILNERHAGQLSYAESLGWSLLKLEDRLWLQRPEIKQILANWSYFYDALRTVFWATTPELALFDPRPAMPGVDATTIGVYRQADQAIIDQMDDAGVEGPFDAPGSNYWAEQLRNDQTVDISLPPVSRPGDEPVEEPVKVQVVATGFNKSIATAGTVIGLLSIAATIAAVVVSIKKKKR